MPYLIRYDMFYVLMWVLLSQGGMDKKRLHYIEGGHHGNREHFINNLVKTMI